MNKMLYAREGAKDILDRTCADLPWQLRLEIDGVELEIPEVSLESLLHPHGMVIVWNKSGAESVVGES